MNLVFSRTQVRPVFDGTESISFPGLKNSDLVFLEIKEKESVNTFKNAMISWNHNNCPCRLC